MPKLWKECHMRQTIPVNPTIITNSHSLNIVPNIPQPVDSSVEIDSDEVSENEMRALEIQIIENPSLEKVHFQKVMQLSLEKVRNRAEAAYVLDHEIDRIPDSAYDDASIVLKMLFDYDLPIPHIGWAEDGSIGFEWRPEEGIATMGIYGDNLVIYGVFFQKNCQVDGVCNLSDRVDTVLFVNFLETLKQLL